MRLTGGWWRIVFAISFMFSGAVIATLPKSNADASLEHQIKSAYLYNLPKFVRWPDSVFNVAHDRMTICIVGHSSMRESLDRLETSHITDHDLNVSFRDFDTSLVGCQMAYIESAMHPNISAVLAWCRDNHVLSVGDQPDFIELGGVISFMFIDDRVRLVISRSAAQAADLQISAKLLELAQVVE